MTVNWHLTWKAWLSLAVAAIAIFGGVWARDAASLNKEAAWVCQPEDDTVCVKKVPFSN
jgi:hypothetical protein